MVPPQYKEGGLHGPEPMVQTDEGADLMHMEAICHHERRGMITRQLFGYDQHDDHIWRWLNHHLRVWGEAHPLRVASAAER